MEENYEKENQVCCCGWSNKLSAGQTFKDYDFYKNNVDARYNYLCSNNPSSVKTYEEKREILAYTANTNFNMLEMNAFYAQSVNGFYILPIWLTELGINVE